MYPIQTILFCMSFCVLFLIGFAIPVHASNTVIQTEPTAVHVRKVAVTTTELASTSETMTTTATTEAVTTTTTEVIPALSVKNLQVSTISVSCLKVTWDATENRDYTITCTVLSEDIAYVENMEFIFPSNSLCYITGLRENANYSITVTPELHEEEKATVQSTTAYAKTETVEVIEEFAREEGWTNCFTYEAASGLTLNPSHAAISGAEEDGITSTGILRNAYGDYCVAMGTFYGYCGDRFLITLENGIQFTVQICDSKGDRWYHDYGTSGKSVIEFIVADNRVPSEVQFTGNYGYYNWSGLNLTANIESIQKINYGNTITY